MRRFGSRSSAAIVAALALALLGAGQNLLRNNSFETPSVKGTENPTVQPEGWNTFGHENDGTRIALTGDLPHTGSQAVRITSTGLRDSYQGLAQSFAVAAGNEYQFTVFVHNDKSTPLQGTARGQISMEWKDDAGAEVDRTWGPDWGSLSVGDWKQFKMTGKAPAKATQCFAVITLHEGKGPGGGAFLVDDPAVTEVSLNQ